MNVIFKTGKKILAWPISKNAHHVFNFNQEVIDEFIIETARKEIKSGSKILDVGAGTVRYKKYFSDCTYLTQDFKSYQDPSGEFMYGEIDYVSDILKIPVEDSSFDVIICTEVFEHIPRPDLAIKEFYRILKNGGTLYITSPLGSGIHHAPYHYYGGFSPYWYNRYLKKYGFENISITPKKHFFALYAIETNRAFMYLVKSKRLFHRLLLPITFPAMIILPLLFFGLDDKRLDQVDPLKEFTLGYKVRAIKSHHE